MGLIDKLRKKEKRRTIVVGLDGVPFSLIQDLKNRGHIANMSLIFDKGYFGQMKVSIPEISSVSWSSFMTGTQSGHHGIFGFMDLEPKTYKLYFPNFTNLKAPTLWEDLAKQDKKSVVMNMPATYPAREINGVLISGFVATDIKKAVYPVSIIQTITEMGYRIDLDLMKARQDHEILFHDLNTTLEARERAVNFFWHEINWDLLIVVITGTDRLMHFLWEAYENKDHLFHKAFIEYFKKVDSFVGRLYDRFICSADSIKEKNHFCMLSDHGFTKIKTEVYLNRWLQENGYLKFKKEKPETIMDIGLGSVAFVLDPSRIYINLKDKYPFGAVEAADYNHVRKELREALEALVYNDGSKIMRRVYLKEELYEGPYLEQAPDLILLSNYGFDLKGRVNANAVFGHSGLVGMHTQDDAFFYSSKGKIAKTIFDIKDIIIDGFQ